MLLLDSIDCSGMVAAVSFGGKVTLHQTTALTQTHIALSAKAEMHNSFNEIVDHRSPVCLCGYHFQFSHMKKIKYVAVLFDVLQSVILFLHSVTCMLWSELTL
jgi:hypothetical protein